MARAGRIAGFGFKCHPHMLRHACGFFLADEGTDTRLIQDYLGPDHLVTDVERFFTALMQALQHAYALGWNDRGDVERSAR